MGAFRFDLTHSVRQSASAQIIFRIGKAPTPARNQRLAIAPVLCLRNAAHASNVARDQSQMKGPRSDRASVGVAGWNSAVYRGSRACRNRMVRIGIRARRVLSGIRKRIPRVRIRDRTAVSDRVRNSGWSSEPMQQEHCSDQTQNDHRHPVRMTPIRRRSWLTLRLRTLPQGTDRERNDTAAARTAASLGRDWNYTSRMPCHRRYP